MLFVTGDTHAEWVRRLGSNSFPEGKEMTKDDFVVILGDFGIWDGSRSENHDLDWLEDKPFTTLFIDGNHENYDILDALPVSDWHGGRVHFLRQSVIHLMRGQVFDICGKTVFTFGGAESHDIRDGILENDDPRIRLWNRDYRRQFRVNHVSWWERELPSMGEMDEGLINLAHNRNRVDYVFTHCGPNSIEKLLVRNPRPNRLTAYLEDVRENIDYGKWLMGHYHTNEQVGEDDSNEFVLFEQIIRLA